MKQLELSDLKSIFAGTGPGGTTVSPDLPPRKTKTVNTDGSYIPEPPPETEEGN